jgi:hypothetical protein
VSLRALDVHRQVVWPGERRHPQGRCEALGFRSACVRALPGASDLLLVVCRVHLSRTRLQMLGRGPILSASGGQRGIGNRYWQIRALAFVNMSGFEQTVRAPLSPSQITGRDRLGCWRRLASLFPEPIWRYAARSARSVRSDVRPPELTGSWRLTCRLPIPLPGKWRLAGHRTNIAFLLRSRVGHRSLKYSRTSQWLSRGRISGT